MGGPDDGRVHGTHPSKSDCEAQLRALYANVPEARQNAMKADKKKGAT